MNDDQKIKERIRANLKAAIKMHIDAIPQAYTIADMNREITRLVLEIFEEKRKNKKK